MDTLTKKRALKWRIPKKLTSKQKKVEKFSIKKKKRAAEEKIAHQEKLGFKKNKNRLKKGKTKTHFFFIAFSKKKGIVFF